ncbi:MAG TPA: hypothetical protein VL947_13095 [Cytophagales bacterium]|nr:hypothetical protein [Cytophagales bacterium]
MDKELKGIYDIRQVGESEIEILTDPWAENAAIWRYNIITEHKTKIRDFPDYKEKEYTQEVQ